MTMSPQNSAAATASFTANPVASVESAPPFSTVSRGYHKGEVHEWMSQALDTIRHLERQAAAFIGTEARTPEGQKLMSEVLAIVADEVAGQQQAAQAQIEQLIAGAHEQADQIIAAARDQAAGINSSATQQAGALVSSARADAKDTTDKAEAYAAAVQDAAGKRLARIAQIHQDTLTRVQDINARVTEVQTVTAKVMAAEQERGAIGDEVTKALAPITASVPRLPVVGVGARS